MAESQSSARSLLRHAVATIAYRGAKTLRGVSPAFADFKAGPSTRTPVQILAHMGDLFDWVLSAARSKPFWKDAPPLPWDQECQRFFASLQALDDFLASDADLAVAESKLFQGGVADALTHVGQIAMLRGLAGEPVKGESYFAADIQTGRVGAEQSPPRREF